MNILCISDWHGHDEALPEVPVDVLVALGDMDWRQIARLDQMFDCPKLGVLGNHDRWDNYARTGFIHLHQQVVEIGGVRFAGFDGSPRYNFKDAPQFEEEQVEQFTSELTGIDVFLAHASPMWTPNFDQTDAHRGFLAYLTYIQRHSPRYFVHGHEHIAQEDTFGRTKVLSVYPTHLLRI